MPKHYYDHVTGPRPLWEAFDSLEAAVGGAINYEDIPYQNRADLEDGATAADKANNPGYQLLIPRSGRVTATIQVPALLPVSTDELAYDVGLLLDSYRSNGLPGDFKIVQANGMVYVIPAKVLGTTGAVQTVTPVMAAMVTVPLAKRNVLETAQAIFDSAYQSTGMRTGMASVFFFPFETVTFGANNESARDALARLFTVVSKRPLSYRLIFDPATTHNRRLDYYLTIHAAAESRSPATVPPPPAMRASSGDGPYFKKTH